MERATKIIIFFMCSMLCATVEASAVLDKDSKEDIGGFQHKRFEPTGGYAEQVSKKKSRYDSIRDKVSKAGISKEQHKKFRPINEHIKETYKAKSLKNIILNKFYLKTGVGKIGYEKFKEVGDGGGYTDKKAKGSSYNIGIGYRFSNAIRADLNFQDIKGKYKDPVDEDIINDAYSRQQNINAVSVFINGYYDIIFLKTIVPYITAGIGISRNKTSDIVVLEETAKGYTQNNFIWNIGAGVQYKFSNNFALDFCYRYMDLGYIKTGRATIKLGSMPGVNFDFGKQKLKGHQIMGSLIYSL
jgi:opacity protein-like surface antigen